MKSKKMRWAGNVARKEGMRNAYKDFVGKRPLGISRRTGEGNINLGETVC
jgi:hypothetical protein